jgi:hypothetical protein
LANQPQAPEQLENEIPAETILLREPEGKQPEKSVADNGLHFLNQAWFATKLSYSSNLRQLFKFSRVLNEYYP